ncbi:MAG: arsenosugar biosynthesis-associated peroxidase-like protein [Bryobacteraceae bacterium]
MAGYYHEDDLSNLSEIGKQSPELWASFQAWYAGVFRDGALHGQIKNVLALAIAHALESPYLIDAYTEECIENGVTVEQMTEAVHVAAVLRSANTLMHGLQMRKAAQRVSQK